MNLLTGRHLPRRTFLRGAGATVALPFLDAMAPAREAWAVTRSRTAMDKTRLIAIEMVHGAAGSNAWGAEQHLWSPPATGKGIDFGPSVLKSLEPYKDCLTIVSDTDVRPAEAKKPKEIGGDHFRSSATFLTQAHPKQTESSDVLAGTSLDQMYAQRFGQDTPVPSMQLCIENVDQAGGCAYGYACVYTDTISWAAPSEPLPMVRDPRVAFDQLFGAGGTPEARLARREASRSILDFVLDEARALRRQLDPEDSRRMDRYLAHVREIERRINQVVARNESGAERDLPGAPAGVPDDFGEHVKLMFDLQALAFEADVTRVFSFKMGRDASSRVYPGSGVDKGFHPASHHGGTPANVLEFAEINRYHVGLVPYLLERLRAIEEPGGTLLDKTMVIYGSPMGDSNVHNHKRCPLFVAGGANGRLDGDLHLRAAPGTPMANVMLSFAHKLGMDDMTSFGDSTGAFSLSG